MMLQRRIASIVCIQHICCVFLILCLSYFCVCEPEPGKTRLRSCTYDIDCIENAFCKNRTYCSCKENYVVYFGPQGGVACVSVASQVGDPCVQDLQCTKPFGTHALCQASKCQCHTMAHFKEGRCYETSKLGQRCKVTNNCKIDSEVAVFCDKSVCVCPYKYHPNLDGTNCLRSSYIGDKCASDESCLTLNSRCNEVCRCKVDYVASRDETLCLRAAVKIGDECKEHSQCEKFLRTAECFNETCQCSKFYHFVPNGTFCWRSVGLGGVCTNNNECIVKPELAGAVGCGQGRCQCLNGYSKDSEDNTMCILSNPNSSPRQTRDTISVMFVSIFSIILVTFVWE